jgi:hypothetical protein
MQAVSAGHDVKLARPAAPVTRQDLVTLSLVPRRSQILARPAQRTAVVAAPVIVAPAGAAWSHGHHLARSRGR